MNYILGSISCSYIKISFFSITSNKFEVKKESLVFNTQKLTQILLSSDWYKEKYDITFFQTEACSL